MREKKSEQHRVYTWRRVHKGEHIGRSIHGGEYIQGEHTRRSTHGGEYTRGEHTRRNTHGGKHTQRSVHTGGVQTGKAYAEESTHGRVLSAQKRAHGVYTSWSIHGRKHR